jgi:hypothetical protein
VGARPLADPHRACRARTTQPALPLHAGAGGGGGGGRHGAPSLMSGHARETIEEDVLKEIDILKSLNQCAQARAHSRGARRARFSVALAAENTSACADARAAASPAPAPRCCACTSTFWVRRAAARAQPRAFSAASARVAC